MHGFDFKLPNSTMIDCWFLDDAGTARWVDRLTGFSHLTLKNIGQSRSGRSIYGISIGDGPATASITARAHADEPAGPMTACLLAAWLAGDSEEAKALREQITFKICPQVNPDGAEANKPWFAPVPDFNRYVRHVKREGPGEDIEFGYPTPGRESLRPENAAVAGFLGSATQSLFHTSLHSMGFAEGAWVLLEAGNAAKMETVRRGMANILHQSGFKLHDIDRRGEKGFTRIAPGFCTTPTSVAMAEHFIAQNDPEMAEKFHWSSMELISNGNPAAFIMVTELPVFSINGGYVPGRKGVETAQDSPAPAPGTTGYEKFRDALRRCTALGDDAGVQHLSQEYDVQPVPFAVQCQGQFDLVRYTLTELCTAKNRYNLSSL